MPMQPPKPIRQPPRKELETGPYAKQLDFLFEASKALHASAPNLAAYLGRSGLQVADRLRSVNFPRRKRETLCNTCGSPLATDAYQTATVSRLTKKAVRRRIGSMNALRTKQTPKPATAKIVCNCVHCGSPSAMYFESEKAADMALAAALSSTA